MQTKRPFQRWKVIFAGVWNNFVMAVLAWWCLNNGRTLMFPLYRTLDDQLVVLDVLQVRKNPWFQPTLLLIPTQGSSLSTLLRPGDTIYAIEELAYSATSSAEACSATLARWSALLDFTSEETPVGFCVSKNQLSQFDFCDKDILETMDDRWKTFTSLKALLQGDIVRCSTNRDCYNANGMSQGLSHTQR